MKLRSVIFLSFALAPACGGAPSQDASVPADAASTSDVSAMVDSAVGADAVAAGDASETVPTLNDCTAAEYVDLTAAAAARTVRPMGSTGYSPRCLIIAQGQSVLFEMDFTMHPLAPGIAHGSSTGVTSPNPITAQTMGTSASVTFAGQGYFPFKCSTHQHVGMAGVVRVIAAR